MQDLTHRHVGIWIGWSIIHQEPDRGQSNVGLGARTEARSSQRGNFRGMRQPGRVGTIWSCRIRARTTIVEYFAIVSPRAQRRAYTI